jgi:hypothetical protein
MKNLSIGGQLQIILSTGALLWGVWLIVPLQTFATSTFAALARLAPEGAWGSAVVLLALGSLYTTVRRNYTWQKCALLALTAWWILLFLLVIEANPASTATVTYPLLAAVSIFAYLQVGLHST